jgi:hypothetical protein
VLRRGGDGGAGQDVGGAFSASAPYAGEYDESGDVGGADHGDGPEAVVCSLHGSAGLVYGSSEPPLDHGCEGGPGYGPFCDIVASSRGDSCTPP